MGPQPELHQSPELGKRDGKLKIGLCRHLAWPRQTSANTCMILREQREPCEEKSCRPAQFLLYASAMFLLMAFCELWKIPARVLAIVNEAQTL